MAKRNGNAAAAAAPAPVEAAAVRMRVDLIAPYPGLNQREDFDPVELQALAESIRANGLINPLTLHETGQPVKHLVAGERRWRAVKLLGWDEVPCTIRKYSEEELIGICLAENLGRAQLNEIEQARSFQHAMQAGLKQGRIAAIAGVSQPTVSNAVRVLQLPPEVLQLVKDGILDMSTLRDQFLAFVKIPEKKRAKLYSTVMKQLRDAWEKKALKEWQNGEVTRMLGAAAKRISHSLDPNTYGEPKPAFDVKLHKQCGCGGPSFKYDWRAEVRCFDDGWWKAQQTAAEAEEERRAEEQLAAAEKAAAAGEEVELPQDAIVLVRGRRIEDDITFDPADLPAGSVAIGTERGERVLFVTDPDALEAAEKKFSERLQAAEQEAEAAAWAELEAEAIRTKVEGWMYLEALRGGWEVRSEAEQIAKRMGIQLNAKELPDIPAGKAQLLFKAALIQIRKEKEAGEHRVYGNRRSAVAEQMRTEAQAKIRAMLPELPRTGVSAEGLPQLTAILDEAAALEGAWGDEDEAQKAKALLERWDSFRQAHLLYEPTEEDLSCIRAAQDVAEQEEDEEEQLEEGDDVATCIICGCTDDEACDGGCSWMVVDRETGRGVCNSHSLTLREAEAKLEEEEAIA
jgi:ParB/RepB/Spo0J family partition protein